MANAYFRFKEFTVWQEKCAMKVGTDGVLLGAWADINGARTALDIGTGTGLIALMLAQRKQKLFIDAMDIDRSAYNQAFVNVNKSPWLERIRLIYGDMAHHFKDKKALYDLIVCNPPFFKDSLKSNDQAKNVARHEATLNAETLFEISGQILTSKGKLILVFPKDREEEIDQIASGLGFFKGKTLYIKPTPLKKENRCLTEFSMVPVKNETRTMILEDSGRHNYSKDYMELTKDFYLNF